jgi:hypothetical protein
LLFAFLFARSDFLSLLWSLRSVIFLGHDL